jgi:S1-C subfamily serine protease
MGVLMSEASMAQADFVPDNDLPVAIGVIVSERIPGFCAARRLLDGDVILGVASPMKAFRNARDLQETIGGLRPGTTVRLLVLRNGQVIEVDLTLDAHPVQNTTDAIEVLRSRRQKKFEDYWKKEFEPLLRPTVG